MDISYNDNGERLDFHIDLGQPDTIDNLAFALLLEAKFRGEVTSVSTFMRTTEMRCASVCVTFPGFGPWSDAAAHCRSHTSDGKINATYLGALDYSDPGRRMARKLLAQAEASE